MSENLERLRELLHKYSSEASSKAEETEMFALLNSSTEAELEPLLTNILEHTEPTYDSKRRERILASVFQQVNSAGIAVETANRNGKVADMWKRIAIAASIVGVLFLAGYWFLNSPSTSLRTTDPSTVAQGDVKAPDKNRAQIKLANGTIVYLDSAGNGELANLNGVTIVKTVDGNIEYSGGASASLSISYNTMFNPRGSKVQQLVLDDGTKVWLNAESSITYPTAFVGNERRVEISGEAYFEVAKDAKKKFYVTGTGVTTEVLGTHFNVNTFKDDGVVRVTLLEGKVKTSIDNPSTGAQDQSAILKPGQQAYTTSNGQLSIDNAVDVEQVMAWKNGQFLFGAGMTVEEIMQQVARWYDIEVVYEKNRNVQLGGSVSRNVNISEVLKILSLTGVVKFEVVGKKVIVK